MVTPPERDALIAKLIRTKFQGVDECRANMKALVESVRALGGGSAGPLPLSRLLIFGFSLGAITALDLALLLEELLDLVFLVVDVF